MEILSIEIPPQVWSAVCFIGGGFVGLFAEYYSNFFTDRRREKEALAARDKVWKIVQETMPQLINAMKADWSSPGCSQVRRFFALHQSMRPPWSASQVFVYHHEEHGNLLNELVILQNQSLVQLVNEHGLIKEYQATEELVAYLLKT